MSGNSFKSEWKDVFSKPSTRYVFILTIIALATALNLFGRFLIFIENRPGVVLNDPLFALFTAHDYNTPVFILIYGSLLTGLIFLLPKPRYLMLALQTYGIMIIFRFMAMYITPLEVPDGIINLRDPLVFTFGTGKVVTKDLFFSGHIASLTILYLTAKNKYLKWIFFSLIFLVAGLIFLQKAHYTIDMLAAPFFAFSAFSIAKKIDAYLYKEKTINDNLNLI